MAFCPPPYPGFFVGEFVREGTHKHKKGEEEGEKKELLKQAAVDQVGFLSLPGSSDGAHRAAPPKNWT